MLKIHSIKRNIQLLLRYMRYGGNITQINISKLYHGEMLRDKKIVITGGTSGIGLAIAEKFIKEGAYVLITGRDKEKLRKAYTAINSSRLLLMEWDVTNFGICEQKVHEAYEKLGNLDVWINNAGYLDHFQPTDNFFDKCIDTNLKAIYKICPYVINQMTLDGVSYPIRKILNISSVNGLMNCTNPYYLSKAALNTYTKGLAKECVSKGIIVNAIAPGYVSSSINIQDTHQNAYFEYSLQKRIILPEEIAELACYVCSDISNGLIGQVLVYDAGRLLM